MQRPVSARFLRLFVVGERRIPTLVCFNGRRTGKIQIRRLAAVLLEQQLIVCQRVLILARAILRLGEITQNIRLLPVLLCRTVIIGRMAKSVDCGLIILFLHLRNAERAILSDCLPARAATAEKQQRDREGNDQSLSLLHDSVPH